MEKKFRLLLLLVLLMTAATGAWAQSTTHVVKQENVNTIFSGDGYTLGDAVKDGDVLDFQGTIDLEGDASHSLVINKPVNIISSTKDAVVKLHTPEGALSGENPGNSFVINKAGSGTTVQDIRIENTETWLYNTSNVTFTGVTMWVEEARVGSGVGHVSIRYSDHVTFDGCTVYTKNNGGSAGCVLTGSHDCTFKDTRFEAVGTAGNILYLGYAFATDKPADYTMNNDNISVLNCTLTKSAASSVGTFMIGGLRHHIEGCTLVKMSTSSPYGATVPNSASEGHTFLNNTITDGALNVLQYSTAEGNTVTGSGNVTIYQGATANNNNITVTSTGKVIVRKGSTVTGNTINGNVTIYSNSSDYIGSTITGNTINGTVTFASNSKNNTLTRNVITSTGDYAVVMASTADANNTVQYNTLKSAKYNGDEAVNPSTGSGNTISNNSNITLTLAEGTEDADKWSVKVGEEAAAFPVGGLNGGETVTATYSGEKKVKSVKAVKKAAAPSVPDGAINGKFSVSDTKQVYFSKGNLRYASSKWSFFDNQYDYYTSYSADAWDKFGWSTSATTYGMNTSTDDNNYSGDFVDWGATMGTGWFTLSRFEWAYLFNTRSASTVNGTENGRYAKAKVNDVMGVILFPDTYTHPDGVTAPTGVNETGNTGWNGNSYSSADWTKMEAAGCVFLPAADSRNGSTVNGEGTNGYYWSATPNSTDAFCVRFYSSGLYPTEYFSRHNGYSVRLVREVTE